MRKYTHFFNTLVYLPYFFYEKPQIFPQSERIGIILCLYGGI